MLNLAKIIVTGGCGFLGSHLVRELVRAGDEVKIIDNLSRGSMDKIKDIKDDVDILNMDLKNRGLTLGAIKDVDMVYHFAAVVSGITWHKEHPADLCANFAINYNVLQACALNKIPKMLYVSSSCVYPTFIQTKECAPYLPENLATVRGAMPSGVYGWSKLMGEVMLHAHMKQFGFKAACIRPFNVYGPHEDFSMDRGHVIPALIRRALAKEDPYEVWGSGEQDRGFTFVEDVTKGILLAAEIIDDGTPINIGYPQKVKIKDLAKKVIKLADYNPEIQFLKDMPEGEFSKGPDITRAKELLDWTPVYDIDSGLERTWNWAKENIKN